MSNYVLGNSLPNIPVDTYDYVFSSPPCYEDLTSFGVTNKKPETYKTEFFDKIVPLFCPKLGTVTIAFTGNRRNNSRILPKFMYVNLSFQENGYYLRDVKYVLKSNSYNAYSSQVIHVYTFQKNEIKGNYNLNRDKLHQTYGKDLWGPFQKEFLVDGEVVGQPIEIAKYCIQNFTNTGDVVYDPFAGVGITLAAAKSLDRNYLGYEIRESIWDYGTKYYEI
jgi:hypothetical protein